MPDPFGGDRNILFALEDGQVVALSNVVPNTKHCVVNVKNEGKSFVDCNGDKLETAELARFVTSTKPSSNGTVLLYVDLRKKEPPPASAEPPTADDRSCRRRLNRRAGQPSSAPSATPRFTEA